jgi:cell volume regulation protein A
LLDHTCIRDNGAEVTIPVFTIDELNLLDHLPILTLLLGSVLLVGAVLSRISRFMGVPSGLLFLAAGMLIGEDGPVGLLFQDYDLVYAIGSIALGLILFHGGLSTPYSTLREAWRPALVLATVGVLGVTLVTGLGVWLSGGVTILAALLIGSILGSTDAAAVFDLLAKQRLKGRARSILEVESGLNDPMAFVLVFAFTEMITYGMDGDPVMLGLGYLMNLCMQLLIGGIIGIFVGLFSVRLLRLGARGGSALYPVLTMSIALITLGGTMLLGGSGLLAVYLAGMIIGNNTIPFRATTERIHDTLAWIAQITMFFLLGILVTPSVLPEFLWGGVMTALWVAIIARPLVVGLILFCFRLPWRENALISWAGVRGAVPIILATIPVLMISEFKEDRSEDIERLFAFIFMVVVIGSVVPGALVRPVAKLLAMRAGTIAEPAVEIDFVAGEALRHRTKTYQVTAGSLADQSTLQQVPLPYDSSVVMVLRDATFFPPRGDTLMKAGDHVTVVFDPDVLNEVDAVFVQPHRES